MKIMNKKLLLLYMSLYPCITNANVYMCLRCPVGTYGDGKSSYCSPCPKIDGAHYLEDSKNCEWECDEGKVVVAKYANGGGCCISSSCPQIYGAHFIEGSKTCEWECDEGKVLVGKYANGGGCCTEPAKPKCPSVKVYVFGNCSGSDSHGGSCQLQYSKTLECGESFQNDGSATNTPNGQYDCITMACRSGGFVKNINGEMWCYKDSYDMKKNKNGRHYDRSGDAKCVK